MVQNLGNPSMGVGDENSGANVSELDYVNAINMAVAAVVTEISVGESGKLGGIKV